MNSMNQQHCPICLNPPDKNMIICIQCHKNYHKLCVNVTPNNNLDLTYKCKKCISSSTCNTTPESVKSISSKTSKNSNKSQNRLLEIELQRLEEERAVSMEFVNKKYKLIHQHEQERQSNASSNGSISIHNWLNELPNPPDSPTNEAPIHQKSAENRISNKTNQNERAPSSHTNFIFPSTFNTVVNKNSNPENKNSNCYTSINSSTSNKPSSTTTIQSTFTAEPIYTFSRIPTSGFAQQFQSQCFTSKKVPPLASTALSNNKFNSHQNAPQYNTTQQFPPLHLPNTSNNFSAGPTQNQSNVCNFSSPLCQSQLQARNSLPKELPLFSGQPEEWPLFSSTFEWSTKICGLTDAENLIRLQKSLKGDALHSVQHILIHPSNVSWVMSILKLMYGQPEKIVNSIKNRIKNTPYVNENNLPSFTSFAVNVKSLIATIEATNLLDEINNSSLLHELLQKLPPSHQLQWGTHKLQLINQNKNPNLYEFSNWIFNIGISASCITVENVSNYKREKTNIVNNNKKAYINTHSDDRKCFVCKNNKCKAIAKCEKFISLPRGEKWDIVRQHKLCKICLFKHSGECKKRSKCGEQGCEYYHHPLLHRFSTTDNNRVENKENNCKQTSNSAVINTHNGETKQVLFKIIPVKVFGKNKTIETFAFIDEGSSISLMDESLMKELEVTGTSNPLYLKWTGDIERCENNSKQLTIKISGGNKKHIKINVNTVTSLNLPSQSLDYKKVSERFPHLGNLPIKSYFNAVPKILIGLNHFDLGISNKIRQGSPHEPVAVHTRIGWMIYGAVGENSKPSKNFNFHICNCNEDQPRLEDLVKSFYSFESIGICCKDLLVSEDEARALRLLREYTLQREDGHYESPLLWKFDILNLPDSYNMALKRLLCLERKLKQNKDLFDVFKNTMEKYLSKKYIRKLEKGELSINRGKVWYLPIFAVFNKNKPGKARIVWDAAAKTNDVSLNSFLTKGPDLIKSLVAILFSFRQKAIAICGDIEEMFHQIFIRPEDRDVQRFLWRDCDEAKEPDIYVMDVMIFGATCAPSISQYIKNLNAKKFEKQFPTAYKAIIENHYVDDLLYSVDTPQEAIDLIKNIKYIHRQGGFNIRNWLSNSTCVLDSISEGTKKEKCLNLTENNHIEKVLGVFWEHQDDIIIFKISSWLKATDVFSTEKIPTKREILRLVMSIYDPLGLIGNITMYVNILLQEVWRTKVDWDEEISLNLADKWSQWVKVLPFIENIKIPRCYLRFLPSYEGVEVQLHTFVDASKDGYAAVCYFRLVKDETVLCSLIGSKTRVAPIKITSVPRLELMAALIGARFANYVCENHTIKICRKFFWTDSKTVISWINSNHRKYTQFVAFRVTEILELTSASDWQWIPTKQNVADEATKWTRVPLINASSRWFTGPQFLYEVENRWPITKFHEDSTTVEMIHQNYIISSTEFLITPTRFSKWNRMLRATAYVFRFISNCKTKNHKKTALTQEELRMAQSYLFRQAQNETYSLEISCLKSGKFVPKKSEIYTKSPLLDEDGVLRIDSRIDNANIPLEQKRPVILPKSSYITTLIILYYHQKYYHINHETVVNEIRQKYSIAKLRVTYKSVVSKCQWCKVYKAVPQVPQMAKLPRSRISAYTAPFSYTGVDFFGPFIVTANRHREKRYGVLFTCLTIRAVHIEISHSLTTSSCILAIRNFMSRRGIPIEFYSDNGTNFIGAERELRDALKDVDSNIFVKTFTSATTKWHFNPPSSPHMGGAWERLVRSVKAVLYKIMPSRAPHDELLLSMLIEVENIINSRPLAYVPIDDETAEAITPNHFLLGSSSGLKPMSSCSDSGQVLKQNWLISQQYANIFWRKWLAEYLPTLTCRSKWFEKRQNLRQGDLVLIVDSSFPRNVWPRGKVIETRLAKDGQVRSAKVLTSHGILERPVAKLAILDVASHEEHDGEEPSCHTAGGNVAATGKIV